MYLCSKSPGTGFTYYMFFRMKSARKNSMRWAGHVNQEGVAWASNLGDETFSDRRLAGGVDQTIRERNLGGRDSTTETRLQAPPQRGREIRITRVSHS